MKTILITGSSGYIGRHLCEVLNREYVVGMDYVFQPQNAEKFILQDINTSIQPLKHFDTVIHLAALVSVGESVNRPDEYFQTNVKGTLNVLENLDFDQFIFASTGAAESPISPYAKTKLQAETLVRNYCTEKNKQHTIFRFYNVIGSAGFEPTNVDGLMYNLMRARYTGEFNLYGNDYSTYDGTAMRDYIHVLEICESIKRAIGQPTGEHLVDNLCSGVGHTVQEIVDTFKIANDCGFKVNYLPRRQGDLESSVLQDMSPYMEKMFTLEQMLKVK